MRALAVALSLTALALLTQPSVADLNPSLPLIGPISIERFCIKKRKVGLGACSSQYVECLSTTGPHRIVACPIGQVFVSAVGDCRPSTDVRECFDFEVNQLNEATESLAKATGFCDRFFGSPVIVPVSNDARCTRQALLCAGSRPPLAIGCPADQTLGFDLRCKPAEPRCFHVSPSIFAPIRANLLSAYCESAPRGRQDESTTSLQSLSSVYDPELRCKNWYVTCGDRQPEFVFCEPGKVFDRERRTCRRVRPEDKCPLIGSCRGLEWRTIPLGDCRKDFLYCEGLRPRFFQCTGDTVFVGDSCVPYSQAGPDCGECALGDFKRAKNCHNFFHCEKRDGRLSWREYKCVGDNVFNWELKRCAPPSGYSCPSEVKCQEGQSHATGCGSYMFCSRGQWQVGKCPRSTMWDPKLARCVLSQSCRPDEGTYAQQCYPGIEEPTEDCNYYRKCVSGQYRTLPCSGAQTSACTQCLKGWAPSEPSNYDNKGYSPRQCIDGENKSSPFDFCYAGSQPLPVTFDCGRYKECDVVHGYYVEKQCPYGTQFDSRKGQCSSDYQCTDQCVEGERKPRQGCGKAQECRGGQWADMKCKKNVAFINGRCDANVQCDGYQPDYENGGRCYNDQTKLHPTDCTKYLRCVYGQFTEASCWNGFTYDPKTNRCVNNYQCEAQYKPDCYDGETRQAGTGQKLCSSEYEVCAAGRWERQNCPYGQFFDADTHRCAQKACDGGDGGGAGQDGGYGQGGYVAPGGECKESSGHAGFRRDPRDCSKYYQCASGKWTSMNCAPGTVFDDKLDVCNWPSAVPGC
ncbi:chitin binding Peritrophin-A domain-containing protein [Aphelenchoides avenae]|nr:chitin binding Peritrophin-A domain-containing protein [Aphelenchus avenae]